MNQGASGTGNADTSSLAKREEEEAAAVVTGSESKTKRTVQRLAELLDTIPAAEELASSWKRNSKKNNEPGLGDLCRSLDAGRKISWIEEERERGVPMWIVVRTCKAAWHHDGTWPLLGHDEDTDDRQSLEGVGEPLSATAATAMRSIHAAHLLLRPAREEGEAASTTQRDRAADHGQSRDGYEPPMRAEPSADAIAEAYRRRGIAVPDADPVMAAAAAADW